MQLARREEPATRIVRIAATVPARVDIAGRLDLPELFVHFPSKAVGTCNLAIDLFTTVTYEPTNDAQSPVLREGGAIERSETQLDFYASKNPYFWLAVRHFELRGGTYSVTSDVPRRYGLGGSSSFMLALLAVHFTATGEFVFNDEFHIARLIDIAREFENSVGLTSAGLQDYVAAAYGYANWWSWGRSDARLLLPCAREPICTPVDSSDLDGCVLLALTGEPHPDNRLIRHRGQPLTKFERGGWLRVASLARDFAQLVRTRRLDELHPLMIEERRLWCGLGRERMSTRIAHLLEAADTLHIGARFAGVPSGGAVWAIGTRPRMQRLAEVWADLTSQWPAACVRPVKLAPGLQVSIQ